MFAGVVGSGVAFVFDIVAVVGVVIDVAVFGDDVGGGAVVSVAVIVDDGIVAGSSLC